MNFLKPIAIICITLTALLMVINVWMSARVAEDGLAIDTLTQKETLLKSSIRNLDQQMVEKTSLHDLSDQAQTLGYATPAHLLNITVAAPIAYQH